MTQPSEKKQPPEFRLVNFSDMDIAFPNSVPLTGTETGDIVKTVKTYADLPVVYLFTKDKTALVRNVLDSLASIRSICYPYALFGIDMPDEETAVLKSSHPELDIFPCKPDKGTIMKAVSEYAAGRFVFDPENLKIKNSNALPQTVDVAIVGAGITGLYAAKTLTEKGFTVCVVEKRERIGGIWARYANTASQVNTSEPAYRLIDGKTRPNTDHSDTREVLEDIVNIAKGVSGNLFLETPAESIRKTDTGYETDVIRNGQRTTVKSKGVILAINDRVGEPRVVTWKNQESFKDKIMTGISDDAAGYDWKGKHVVITGMGAFAIENARTALENGANHVTVVCRRHGTVCPKIIDYLNFSTPYDDKFEHDKKSNMRNMLLWKKLYDTSGATQPECWMGKIKHTGHTISVSDIWFIGHFLKKISTVAGSITEMNESGVVVNGSLHIKADCVVNCIGFHRNASLVKDLCGYTVMHNTNYLDKDFMYLADAYIDDDVFNSFFGSSVLEMARFYMNVYIKFFDSPEFEAMLRKDGMETIDIETRSWSHYIKGAMSLISAYPDLRKAVDEQVARRSANFHSYMDLVSYIAANKREWLETHSILAGRTMAEEECLPYVFEKLINK